MKSAKENSIVRCHSRFIGLALVGAFIAGTFPGSSALADGTQKEPLLKVDPTLPIYTPAGRSEKPLTSIGSDSMGDLVERWADAYSKLQPVAIKVEHQGSASAPAALIEGSADLGPMARAMKPTELNGFIARYGFEPTQVRTAIAGVAIYVSKTNPLHEITFDQLNAIYSAQPKSGLTRPESWQALLPGKDTTDLDSTKEGTPGIYALGANMDPYAFAYFRQQVLEATDLDSRVTSTDDVRSIFEVIQKNPNAIGFGLLATPPAGVKMLAVKRTTGDRSVMPTEAELKKGNYPLGRFLNVYIVRDPDKGTNKGIDDGVKDFLTFILSKQGQTLVAKEGLMPLSPSLVAAERSRLGL